MAGMRGWLGTRGKSLAWSVLGGLVAVATFAGMAEAFVRFFPPRDLHTYLGESSPLTGPFAPDDDFGAGYRSWAAFRDDNAERLAQFGPFDSAGDPRPVWA